MRENLGRKLLERSEVLAEMAKFHLATGEVDISSLTQDGFSGASDYEVILDWITHRYDATTNVFLAELFEFVRNERVSVAGVPRELFPCKCCGYRTLDEVDEYDICGWCCWEDDGTSSPSIRSSPNRGSMSDYRKSLSEQDRQKPFHRWMMK